MTDHNKAFAFTKKAFALLFPDADQETCQVPNLYFNWKFVPPKDSGVNMILERFMVVNDTKYDEKMKGWVNLANRLGLLPILITTMDDEYPGTEWPDGGTELWINSYHVRRSNEKHIPEPDDCRPLVCQITPLESRLPQELQQLRDELVVPERGILGSWIGALTDDKEIYWSSQLAPIFWPTYADGLQNWVNKPGLYEQHLQQLGELPYHLTYPEQDFDWDDFEFKPTAEMLKANETIYIPCKWAPYCGIGVHQGEPKAFGFLKAENDGSWKFGDQLRIDIELMLKA